MKDENKTKAELIAELVETRERLKSSRKSENLYKLFTEITSDYIISLRVSSDKKLTVEWTLGSYLEMIGREPPEGETLVKSYTHPDDVERVDRDLARTMQNEPTVTEHRKYKVDGSLIWIRVTRHPVWDEKQQRVIRFYAVVQDITKRKNAEGKLRYLRKYLENIIDSMPSSLIGLDAKGRITQWNSEAERVSGLRASETLGLRLEEAIPHLASEQARVESAIKMRKVKKHLRKVRQIEGKTHYEDLTIFPLTANGVEGAVIRIDDITERIKAENLLRESEIRNRAILNAIPDLMFVISHDGTFLDYHTANESMLYAHPDRFLGKKLSGVFPSEFASIFLKLVKGAISGGETQMHEYSLPVAEELRHFLARVVLYSNDSALVIIQDTTEQVWMKKALEKSEEKYRLLSENIDAILWEFDVVLDRWTYVSPQVKRILGYSPEEFTNLQFWVDRIDENDRAWASAYCVEQVQKGKSHKFEYRFMKKNGDSLWLRDVVQLEMKEQTVVKMRGLMIDITDRKKMQEAMIQSEKMLSVGGLAAGMAHEINNPLAGMMQSASVLSYRLTDIELPANLNAAKESGIDMVALKRFMEMRNIPRMLDAINISGQRISKIVENMLSFSRKGEEFISTLDVEVLLDDALELASTDYNLKKHYDFKDIVVTKEYAENLPFAPCEGSKIQQVFMNILRNGAQAMHEYGTQDKMRPPRFFLRLVYEKDTDFIRIEIEDNGPGMDEATRKRVFEPFFTTKPVGDGTGLGLSVSYFIITENHGGTLEVNSVPGQGTNFIIRLPVTRKDRFP